jgi:SEC-C motif domain protein
MTCPCGSTLGYDACCGRWHEGEPAPTAEALMRSRYAAFALCKKPYLLATWHPSTRPPALAFEAGTKWLGLIILGASNASGAATVEFIARFRIGGGSAERIHERSKFIREQGLWFYVDGVQPAQDCVSQPHHELHAERK